MGLGEKCTLTCSPDYAYGEAGSGDLIPPNATLVFEVNNKFYLFSFFNSFNLLFKVELLSFK